ncbi:MAG: DNA-protecting protein DprA [Deltaproteobacteria bacterium]|nr:DNA-protecting protein DprA [Deltaproteobacteria bacterium]
MSESQEDGLVTAEERATLAFFSVEGIGPKTLLKIVEEFGSLAAALREPMARVAGVIANETTQARLVQTRDIGTLADRNLERAAQVGAKVVFPGRSLWPRQLTDAGFPPVIYVRGTIDPLAHRVAIVGSRETDSYGEELAAFFAGSFAARGVCVVSGGALGVDAAAHRACLGMGGPTIAVLGTGVDLAYPGEHQFLFREIVAKGGAVVSHFPPGTPAVKQNFRVRNRVIAALSEAVIVARAGVKSGALGTALAAVELGRPAFAIPGDVTCPLASGVNSLLENAQARACTGLAPVAQAMGLKGEKWPSAVPDVEDRSRRPVARSKAPRPRAAVSIERAEVPGELKPVWDALGAEPVQFDELLKRTGLQAAALATALVRLEVMGLCEERLGKVFVRA